MTRQLLTASDPTVGITARVSAMGQAWHMHSRESELRDSVAHDSVIAAEELVLTEVARHERIVRVVTQFANSADQPYLTDGVRAWLRDLLSP